MHLNLSERLWIVSGLTCYDPTYAFSGFFSFSVCRWWYFPACPVSYWTLLSSRSHLWGGVPLSSRHSAEPAWSLQLWSLSIVPSWYEKNNNQKYCNTRQRIWTQLNIRIWFGRRPNLSTVVFSWKSPHEEFYFFVSDFFLPAGMFCAQPGLSEPTGLCQAGYFCPAGSTSPNSTEYQVHTRATVRSNRSCPLGLFLQSYQQAISLFFIINLNLYKKTNIKLDC